MNKRSAYSVNRRDVLKRGLLGAGTLPFLNFSCATNPGIPKVAVAKSVIQIWMWGGPSHLDTFDPKPDAGYDYCGPLDSPIKTNVDGIQIGQSLPKLAQMADKYSILRSMTHGVFAHETSSYMVQTGREAGDGQVYPCVGSVVSLFKGYDAGYKGLIPPYIVLTQPQGRFSEAGFLGSKYKPFATGGDPGKTPFVVEGVVAVASRTFCRRRRKGRRSGGIGTPRCSFRPTIRAPCTSRATASSRLSPGSTNPASVE